MHNVTIAPVPLRVVTFCMYAMHFVTSQRTDRSIVTKDMLGYLVSRIRSMQNLTSVAFRAGPCHVLRASFAGLP